MAYFDCFNGAGGDMIVASLLDAGVDPDELRAGLSALNVDGYELSMERVTKQGFAATRFAVALDESASQPHRHLKDILAIIAAASLPVSVADRAARIFENLAEAEAKVHGTSIEKVHFHEVGAVDAILDVVGAVLSLHLLGVRRVICSPLPTGSGTIMCDHGVMPVPAPATAELLKGVPLAKTDEVGELLTPTAAAVLTTLADEFSALPAMTIDALGYGAGTRDGQHRPNLLRVMIGRAEAEGEADAIAVLETNLDDVPPELVAHAMDRLLEEGALDVYALPIYMKKSRNGILLTVMCDFVRVSSLERIIFEETGTFGIRRHDVSRVKLRRRHESVETPFGTIRVKVGERSGVTTTSPEFEDCKAAARKHGAAVRDVMAAANLAWSKLGKA